MNVDVSMVLAHLLLGNAIAVHSKSCETGLKKQPGLGRENCHESSMSQQQSFLDASGHLAVCLWMPWVTHQALETADLCLVETADFR